MRRLLRHKDVALWASRWLAIQIFRGPYLSLGVHVDFARPYVDVHVLWVIVSIGVQPWLTDARERYRHTCRGFLFVDDPVL